MITENIIVDTRNKNKTDELSLSDVSGAKQIAIRSWPDKQQVHASLLSITLLFIALITLWLGQNLPTALPKTIEVREVALMVPPPPAPPPPMQQKVVETAINVQVKGAGPALPKIDVKQRINPIRPKLPTINTEPSQWQSLAIDWNTLDLNQLDDLPKLLTPLRVTFPKSLSRRGIKQVVVKLDVVIDEQGQVSLVSIVENAHPELVSEIQKLVRNSRFSTPQKEGQPVRARFIWPVAIKS